MKSHNVRIIAGRWRGRHIHFPHVAAIRPTPDRVRETVFNWLMHDIVGAHCLDAFAGSGAMGLEALSRGAAQVVFLDKHPDVVKGLKQILSELELDTEAVVKKTDTTKWLKRPCESPFNIIFIDPPFHRGLVVPVLAGIIEFGWLAADGLIYIESENEVDEAAVASFELRILKQKKSGDVHYALLGRA